MAVQTENGQQEELVAIVQGVLSKKDLPPFKDKIR